VERDQDIGARAVIEIGHDARVVTNRAHEARPTLGGASVPDSRAASRGTDENHSHAGSKI
jgi:hypothetical protein